MSSILVTGGTGGLGRPTVERLRAAGHDVRVLSRTEGEGRVVGDLTTGAGLDAALDGIDTVMHLATNRRKDTPATVRLLEAARGVDHFVFISIVGVDRIPYSYYRDKVETERAIEESGIPFTILRATQFHDFVGEFLALQRKWPVLVAPRVPVNTIRIEEVADRLVELAEHAPAGRVPDIGGPEHLSIRDCVDEWQRAHGTRKRVWSIRIPGKIGAAFAAGNHMAPLPGYGTGTFAEYAAREAAK